MKKFSPFAAFVPSVVIPILFFDGLFFFHEGDDFAEIIRNGFEFGDGFAGVLHENSPAIYRWVADSQFHQSPAGAKERITRTNMRRDAGAGRRSLC